ncbi:TadE family protein [Rubinisphaera margarita]|uniref:TadE family protein n=1 Tax=Rubinisphaera margarita TaxID=2909586 RepID=UPI001EE7CD2B|nr:TadE family protein [Rubinisphaera margarita]MCG6156799.1 pilus assembly protein [Rubinisphaera margarita]
MITQPKQTRRKGFTSMELAMTLPILLLMLFAVFEFSMLFFARGTVVEASRLGARAATHPGTSQEYIEESVLTALGPKLSRNAEVITEIGTFAGDPVLVVVKVPMRAASPDMLWPIGFGLKDKHLVAETVMQRE